MEIEIHFDVFTDRFDNYWMYCHQLIYVATRVATRKYRKNKASFVKTAGQEIFGDSHKEALLNEGHIQSQLDLELSKDLN